MKKSFTLLELLIVVSLLMTVAIVVLVALNPWGQINKSYDGKRKTELIQLSKILEDYYNDNNCYPKPSEVCYPLINGTSCNICGNNSNSPDFNPYLSRLPCDPQHPTKKYLYQVDSISCPIWFRVFTILSNTTDPAIAEVGCTDGCPTNLNYNYGVSSPNTGL